MDAKSTASFSTDEAPPGWLRFYFNKRHELSFPLGLATSLKYCCSSYGKSKEVE